jgi:hypothetical protein
MLNFGALTPVSGQAHLDMMTGLIQPQRARYFSIPARLEVKTAGLSLGASNCETPRLL